MVRSAAWELSSQTVGSLPEPVRLLKKRDEASDPENLNLFRGKL